MSWRTVILLLLATLLYSANSWNSSVYILDEAKNAGCAMEMYQQDEWIVPTFNAELRTDKPPLHYYFMKVAFEVFGVNAFAARLFSSVMGVLMVMVVFLFSRKLITERSAFYAALILLSSLQLAVQFHLAVPDPYFIFFLTLGWLSFIYAFATNQSRFYFVFYGSIALATLAKGPAAIVFTGLIVLIFLILQHNFSWTTLMKIKLPQGVLLFLLMVLPWYVLVGVETQGEWLQQFFIKHNVGRFARSMEGHGGFPLASLVIAIVALMPFSFFAPQAFRMIWCERKQNSFLMFALIAMSVILVFFAFSRTILPSYPEPSLPFFAILLGYFFDKIQRQPMPGKVWINAVVYTVLAFALPGVVYFVIRQDSGLADLASYAWYFVLLTVGAVVGLICFWQGKVQAGLYAYGTSSVVFLFVFFYLIFPAMDKRNPVVQSLAVMHDESAAVIAYKDFNPAFVFGLQKTIRKAESIEELETILHHENNIYLLTRKKYIPELSRFGLIKLYEGKDFFERKVSVVLTK